MTQAHSVQGEIPGPVPLDHTSLGVSIYCPICKVSRTYGINEVLTQLQHRVIRATGIDIRCHCGWAAQIAIGWHDRKDGWTGRTIGADYEGEALAVYDEAGLCPGCNRGQQ